MSGPTPKRMKLSSTAYLSQDAASDIIRKAQEVTFPWEEGVPVVIARWFEVFGKTYNTIHEFLFLGSVSATAALMGPHSIVKVRDTYTEPTNIYTICMAPPGAGKSQAFRESIMAPIDSLGLPASKILVDDYTRRGIFSHLQQQGGRALAAYEEMSAFFDLIQKRQLELSAERQLYCRLYDGGKWTSITGSINQETRQEVDKVCVAIHGYLQPGPFLMRQYPLLAELNDGFVDRFLLCSPKPKLLMQAEVDAWHAKLKDETLQSLSQPYKLICKWHAQATPTDPFEYTYTPEGKEVYRSFSDEMASLMNEQFESCKMTYGNVSKDNRVMIRLSGILHVFYQAMEIAMNKPEADWPLQPSFLITEEVARMAVALTEYFQTQRQIYEQANTAAGQQKETDEDTGASLSKTILMTTGAYVTPRSTVRNMTVRKKPKADEVVTAMKKLEDDGLGRFYKMNRVETVFYKPLPTDNNKTAITSIIGEEHWGSYWDLFQIPDKRFITNAQHQRIITASNDKDELLTNYGYSLPQEEENSE